MSTGEYRVYNILSLAGESLKYVDGRFNNYSYDITDGKSILGDLDFSELRNYNPIGLCLEPDFDTKYLKNEANESFIGVVNDWDLKLIDLIDEAKPMHVPCHSPFYEPDYYFGKVSTLMNYTSSFEILDNGFVCRDVLYLCDVKKLRRLLVEYAICVR